MEWRRFVTYLWDDPRILFSAAERQFRSSLVGLVMYFCTT